MEKEKLQSTVIAYTYRYIMKDKKGNMSVRYVTDVQEGHIAFQKAICENKEIVSCMREYVNEINYAYLLFTEPVKKEETEEINK